MQTQLPTGKEAQNRAKGGTKSLSSDPHRAGRVTGAVPDHRHPSESDTYTVETHSRDAHTEGRAPRDKSRLAESTRRETQGSLLGYNPFVPPTEWGVRGIHPITSDTLLAFTVPEGCQVLFQTMPFAPYHGIESYSFSSYYKAGVKWEHPGVTWVSLGVPDELAQCRMYWTVFWVQDADGRSVWKTESPHLFLFMDPPVIQENDRKDAPALLALGMSSIPRDIWDPALFHEISDTLYSIHAEVAGSSKTESDWKDFVGRLGYSLARAHTGGKVEESHVFGLIESAKTELFSVAEGDRKKAANPTPTGDAVAAPPISATRVRADGEAEAPHVGTGPASTGGAGTGPAALRPLQPMIMQVTRIVGKDSKVMSVRFSRELKDDDKVFRRTSTFLTEGITTIPIRGRMKLDSTHQGYYFYSFPIVESDLSFVQISTENSAGEEENSGVAAYVCSLTPTAGTVPGVKKALFDFWVAMQWPVSVIQGIDAAIKKKGYMGRWTFESLRSEIRGQIQAVLDQGSTNLSTLTEFDELASPPKPATSVGVTTDESAKTTVEEDEEGEDEESD
jgi:hypothetical protein